MAVKARARGPARRCSYCLGELEGELCECGGSHRGCLETHGSCPACLRSAFAPWEAQPVAPWKGLGFLGHWTFPALALILVAGHVAGVLLGSWGVLLATLTSLSVSFYMAWLFTSSQ